MVPLGTSGSGTALLETFKAVAQKKGPTAAIQWLLNSRAAGPLQALIKTPQGRTALAVAAVSFYVGWAVGSNARRAQALVTALKTVSDQNLPPVQAAQQVARVLQAALINGKTAKPVAPDRTAAQRQVQSITTSLKSAQDDLKLTEQLLKKRPGDQDLQIIFKGQKARVSDLQGKLNALRQQQAAPSTGSSTRLPAPKPVVNPNRKPVKLAQLPTKIEELSPWLQGEVRSGRMTFERAVEVVKNEAIRRATMPEEQLDPPKTCSAEVEIDNEHTVNNGKIRTESTISVAVEGSQGTASTRMWRVKVSNPETNKMLVTHAGGEVPGPSSQVYLYPEMTGTYSYENPQPSPTVEVDATCKFTDGTVLPAAVHTNTNNR